MLAFEAAERLAEGAGHSAYETAARTLKANPGKSDAHNQATHAAERAYLEAVIAAAEKYGIIGGWKTTLAHLPQPVSAATWASGRGKW